MRVQCPPWHRSTMLRPIELDGKSGSCPTQRSMQLFKRGEAPKHAHARARQRQTEPHCEASHSTQPWTAGSGATTHRRRQEMN